MQDRPLPSVTQAYTNKPIIDNMEHFAEGRHWRRLAKLATQRPDIFHEQKTHLENIARESGHEELANLLQSDEALPAFQIKSAAMEGNVEKLDRLIEAHDTAYKLIEHQLVYDAEKDRQPKTAIHLIVDKELDYEDDHVLVKDVERSPGQFAAMSEDRDDPFAEMARKQKTVEVLADAAFNFRYTEEDEERKPEQGQHTSATIKLHKMVKLFHDSLAKTTDGKSYRFDSDDKPIIEDASKHLEIKDILKDHPLHPYFIELMDRTQSLKDADQPTVGSMLKKHATGSHTGLLVKQWSETHDSFGKAFAAYVKEVQPSQQWQTAVSDDAPGRSANSR